MGEPGSDVGDPVIHGDGQLAAATRERFGEVDFCWVCWDTPVDENDASDLDAMFALMGPAFWDLPSGSLVVVSSQMPVGTCRELEDAYPHLRFAVVPENIRIKEGADDYKAATRFVVGTRHPEHHEFFLSFFNGYRVLFMSPESAEMVKHALNGYLGMCIAYINEIADLAAAHGADIDDVTNGLLSDKRVSYEAPLRAGGPFTGGTLGRDLATMRRLAPDAQVIAAVIESNRQRLWIREMHSG